MNELGALHDKMCGTSTPTPSVQKNSNYFSWTPITPALIGSSKLQNASTVSFPIPSVIPSTVEEVLIYASVVSGYSTKVYGDVKIFTEIENEQYAKYLLLESYPQNAINTNSENMWFPMPPNRRLYLTVPVAFGTRVGVNLLAIGYR